MGLGEALENRVRPLVKSGQLKSLEGVDGPTSEKKQTNKKNDGNRKGELGGDGEHSEV